MWHHFTWFTRMVPCAFSSSANTTSTCPFWHAMKSGVAPTSVLAWVASIAASIRASVRVSVRVTLRMRVWGLGLGYTHIPVHRYSHAAVQPRSTVQLQALQLLPVAREPGLPSGGVGTGRLGRQL